MPFKNKKQSIEYQAGFHLVAVVVVLAVTGLIGLVGWKVLNKGEENKQTPAKSTQASSQTKPTNNEQQFVEWSFNNTTWKPVGKAPACPEPLTIGAPMDVKQATNVLLPGQMRGNDFKPHGGIGIETAATNNVSVYAMMDGYVYQGSRYIEGGVVQYMFDFMNSCGIRYRYDHLATLSDTFMQYANQLPEPKVDDSRTTRLSKPGFVKQGTLIATAVGTANPVNAYFDVGVYDLRKPNAASKTSAYQTDTKRIEDKEQSFFSVCWFDLLPDAEKAAVKKLPSRGGAKESTSDYCAVN